MQSLTSTLVQNPQTQVTEGLNSSTSSLDSAMWLDSLSSLEPSPISSASSSFAPRPNGKEDTDVSTKQQHEDMTQVVSKLCTEMQKAGNDSNMDGSASSIGSSDSCNTLKPEDEDVGVFIPQSTTPPPTSCCVKQSESSSSSTEEVRSLSRPSSELRVTTPVSSDVVSYAPETIEKLKKLERLKQKKITMEKENQSKDKDKSHDRRFSSPIISTFSKLKISSMKLKTHSETAEDTGVEPPKSKTPTLGRREYSPVPIRDQHSPVPIRDQPSPVPIRDQHSPVPIRDQHSPVPIRDKQSPVPIRDKHSPVLKRDKQSPVLDRNIKHSLESTHNSKSPVPIPKAHSPVPNNTRQTQSSTTDVPTIHEPSKTPTLPLTVSVSHKHEQSPSIKSSPFETPPTNSKISSPESFRSPSPVNNRGSKSHSPQVANSKAPLTTNRLTKSVSPANNSITMRNKAMKQQTNPIWRQTPHIDPDAIEALLNLDGDVDADFLNGHLETCAEEVEPQPLSVDTGKKTTPVSKFEESPSILKRSILSDSDVVKRDGPKKSVKISPRQRNTKHQSMYFGSPERSPAQDGPGPLKNDRIPNRLQRSLTLSYSSPDLSTILAGGKSRSKNLLREDSYVTSSATPKASNRRGFFGGVSLTRSLTMSGKGNKKSPAYFRDKYKLRKKE